MPGQYSSHFRSRPCAPLPAAATTGRLFLCARCHAQVLVCSHCDRGQIYCAQGCAQTARRDAQRAAGQRYQVSRRGRVLRLLERYGAAELDAAIREAIARGVPHPNAVRLALDHRRELRNEAPPVAVSLPEHVKARDAHVQPHRLEPYDQLKEQADE